MRRTKAECKKISKKVLLAMLSLICIANIMACGTETENDTDEQEVPIENVEEEESVTVGDAVMDEDAEENVSEEIEITQTVAEEQGAIVPGSTWYYEEETVIKYININVDDACGVAYVEGFVTDYSGNPLSEYHFEKMCYIEDYGFAAEDQSMDIYTDYMQITDYEDGFYDGYYALIE